MLYLTVMNHTFGNFSNKMNQITIIYEKHFNCATQALSVKKLK